MADGYLTFDTKLNTAGFKSGLGQVTGMFTKLAALAGVAFSVGAVVAFGKAAVQAAGQAEAKFKGLEFLMRANGRSMSQATAFIKEFTADGLVPMTSAYESYKNMVSRGYSTEQIEKMLSVMKDAAVYNRQGQFTMGEAMEKATMGLRMENSLLTDSVGIQKNVAKMWQEYAQSIGTTANNLTMVQKRQAEFNGFMKEGGVFAGAAAEYADSYAGRIAGISAAFQNLKVAVGNAVIPFINALLPAITNAILWFTKLFNIVGRVVNLLFGTNVGMADAEAAIAGSAEQTAAATEQTAANTEAAGKAAKGALASFDKLNVLAQTEEGGGAPDEGGGGGGMPMPVPDTEPTLGALDEMEERIQEFITRIKELFSGDFSQIGQNLSAGIIGALTKAREAVQGFDFKGFGAGVGNGLNTIVSSIQSFLLNIDFKTIGTQFGGLMSDVFKGGLDTAIGFLQTVDWSNVGTTLWTAFLSVIEFVKGYLTGYDWGGVVSRVFELLGSAFGAAASFIAGLATAIWESLKSAWAGVKEYFEGFKDEAGGDIWQGIKDGIVNAGKNLYEWVKEHVVQPFIDGFKKAFGIASPSTVMAEQGGYIIDGLKEGIANAWANIEAWFTEKVLTPLKEWFSKAWEDIKAGAETAWTKITEVWQTVKDWFEAKVITPIEVIFTAVWLTIKSVVSGAWDGIKEIWQGAKDWFTEKVLDPIKEGFTSVWEDISNVIKGVINGIIGFINGMISGIVGGINAVIGLLNKLHFDIPDWIPLIGGKTFGFNIAPLTAPQIPLMATGAVIPPNAPFMAVMGDQRRGTNLEAPEALIRQIVREEAGNAGGQNITITFGGTMGELVRQLKPHIERENNRVGGSLIAKAVRA